METTSILDSVDRSVLKGGLSSVSERYYEHKYCNKIVKVTDDLHHRVSFHTNKICMLSLADNHPVIREKMKVKRVNFEIDDDTDRMKNVASGKSKRGAQKLGPESVVCYVETENGKYPVYSCVKGKLIEINENLIDNPDLLTEKPISEGYIALILPVLNMYVACKESMLTKDNYLSTC